MRKKALHLGCGGIIFPSTDELEWINIDIYAQEGKVDRIFDVSEPLDYETGSIGRIETYHLFEHLPYHSVPSVVTSWYQVLEKGGKLVLEMPDFDGLIKLLLIEPNDEQLLKYVFGSQERKGQYHSWGWNKTRLQALLESVGFTVVFEEPQDYHKEEAPCLRVIATKI